MSQWSSFAFVMVLWFGATALAEDERVAVHISEAKRDASGVLVHDVRSPYQAGTTRIHVLCPDRLDRAKAYPVVYLLPVEARDESRFGDGMSEATRGDLANRHQAIFVSPTFSHLPWYADHPTDPEIRQETYLLNVVLPFVERQYPARPAASGRLLVGFSKSGWGAFSLLLRHPDVFGRAVAWDAPLMMDEPGKYGSGDIFGTTGNFEQYQVSKLLDRRAGDLREGARLVLLGYGNFREHHQRAHAVMDARKIAHVYEDGPARKHEWGSGWLPGAVAAVLKGAADAAPARPADVPGTR